ncbi:Conserved hypothetical protein CHP02466 [uncultured Caudovirales phage]|uniref:Uncharacterized protein n=1 Tax=uncultured Caudovirales phage TaxID=2100421 RepID=A0A6J7WTM6_9CAUD|nr:Conserved hypothetical protein CHP02466 [uncultured Caudovirales phage]
MSKFLMMNLFPVNCAMFNLGEESRGMNSQILREVYELKKVLAPEKRSGRGVFQSQQDLEKDFDIFSKLRDHFTPLATSFLQESGFIGDPWEYLELGSFWFNYNSNQNAYHLPHTHGYGETMFSGVYFPTSGILNGEHESSNQNLDEDISLNFTNNPAPGDLVLLDPNHALKRAVTVSKQTYYPYYGNSLSITPREGLLVIFPAYLMHMVVPTEKENFERLTIVFDISKKQ